MDSGRLTQTQVPPAGGAADLREREPVSPLVTADLLLTAALWWAARGLAVFPCQAGGKEPATTHGFQDAVTDEERIRSWWRGRPYNIAVSTGHPGPDVLDVDVRPDGSGWPAFNRLKAAGLLAGAHLLVRTPSGGAHLHFAGTAQRCGRLPAAHLDLKAIGGYVLVPPSQVGGRPYELVDDRPPTGAVLDWEAARRLLSPARPVAVQAPGGYAGSVAHLPAWMAQQPPGNRNAALYWAACRAAEAGDLGVLRELASAAVQAGLGEHEARQTVISAARRVNNRDR